MRGKKPKLSRLAKDKLNPYSRYWKRRAHEAFMKKYRGLPCFVCGTTVNTCAHHLLPQGRFGLLALVEKNIIPLCPNHHDFSTDISAHGTSYLAQRRFSLMLESVFPDKVEWMEQAERAYKQLNSKIDYKELYDKLIEEGV